MFIYNDDALMLGKGSECARGMHCNNDISTCATCKVSGEQSTVSGWTNHDAVLIKAYAVEVC